MKTFFMAIMFVAMTSSGPDAYVVTHEFEVESQKRPVRCARISSTSRSSIPKITTASRSSMGDALSER